MKLYLSAIISLSLLSACTHFSPESAEVEQAYNHTFTAVGLAPVQAQAGDSLDQKILNAIKASKLEAYREMAEQIYGVLVVANNNTQESVLETDVIQAKVKGLVRGARVLKSYHEGDVYITELELDMETLPFLKATELNQQGISIVTQDSGVYY